MNITELPRITKRGLKRVGQGHGSGRGKTSGRGTKGQKARRDIPLKFEGGALPLIKRLPFLRGKDKNNVFRAKPYVLSAGKLSVLPKNATVDVALLVEKGLVPSDAIRDGVKILQGGELTHAVTLAVPVSKTAAEQVVKAGGTVKTNEA